MSGLIEYCIELNAAAEGTAQGTAVAAAVASSSSDRQHFQAPRQAPKLQRQESVLCSRLQHLSTIDYVDDGKPGQCASLKMCPIYLQGF